MSDQKYTPYPVLCIGLNPLVQTPIFTATDLQSWYKIHGKYNIF